MRTTFTLDDGIAFRLATRAVIVLVVLFCSSCRAKKEPLEEASESLRFLEDRSTVESRLAGFAVRSMDSVSKNSSELRHLFNSRFPPTNCVVRTIVWYERSRGAFLWEENLNLYFDENDKLVGYWYWLPD